MSAQTPSPLVDTHVHFWQEATPDRPHDGDGVGIGPAHPVESVVSTAMAAGVTHVVQVTPSLMGFDNQYSLEGARAYPGVVSVLGRVDPAADNSHEALVAWSENPEAVGVRLTLFPGKHPDGWVSAWDDFWVTCSKLGLVVSLFAPSQPERVGDLADRHPELTIVMDHLAVDRSMPSPNHIRAVLELERFPNVYPKISSLPEISNESYPFVDAQQVFARVYDVFGADRLMWGSNYPPVLAKCSYAQSVDVLREHAGFMTPTDRDKVLGLTASRVLDLPGRLTS